MFFNKQREGFLFKYLSINYFPVLMLNLLKNLETELKFYSEERVLKDIKIIAKTNYKLEALIYQAFIVLFGIPFVVMEEGILKKRVGDQNSVNMTREMEYLFNKRVFPKFDFVFYFDVKSFMKNLKDSYSFIEKKQSKEFLMTCPLLYSKQDFDCFSLNIEKALNGKGIVYYFEKKSTYYALKDSFCRAIFRFNI